MTDTLDRLKAALADRYTILEELGAGGMATVYLAEDLKHERKVAVKVLRPELAAVLGAERFVKEIKTTANLQHPHILPLFDSGEADSFLYYVMPFIDGETLRDKLNRETQLGIDEAVNITTAVADALDYAHRQNVIHRDIKPENILLHDGRPMVADFGIALAVSAAAGGRMTETGLSLGTPHYMSPEQATAEKDLTHRSDIYSLGSVLYEMLTGEPPHIGGSAQAIIMKIVTEPAAPVTKIRKSVPPHVAAATAKSLEKLAADRFESAAKFGEALTNPAFTLPVTQAAAVAGAAARGRWSRLSVGLAAVAALFAAVAAWALLGPEPPTRSVIRSVIALPEGDRIALADLAPSGTGRPSLALSRDGTQLVYVIARGDVSQLFLRKLDEFEGHPLPGTEGAFHPFFSPDGQWIGFFTATELMKISVGGGAPQTLSSATYAVGASWGENDTILFAQDEGRSLSRVSADGSDVAAALPDMGDDIFFWPQLLPDGQSVLVTDQAGGRPSVVVVSLITGERKTLVPRGSGAQYIQSGHLVYAGEAGVMAVPFDPSRLTVTGTPTPVLSDVRREAYGGVPQMAVSAAGLLAYIPGVDMQVSTPVWVNRSGALEPASLRPNRYGALDLSPDGRHLAITIYGTTTDVWLSDFTPGSEPRRLTTLGGNNEGPAWAGDGSRVAFSSDILNPEQIGTTAIFWQSIDGGRAQPLMPETFTRWSVARAWSRDGVFGFSVDDPDTGWDIWVLPSDSLEPRPLKGSLGAQWAGDFSPDGRWFAYQSDQSGQLEVYVTDYPAGKQEILLSTNAGQGKEPIWSPKGNEVFFRSDQHLFSVSVELGSELRPGTPRPLFEGPFVTVIGAEFDVDPEGQRFLMLREPEQPQATQIRLVTNWFEELKAKVGNEP